MIEGTPKERPILFSGPMVRAILAGRKTQTRRVGSYQSPEYTELGWATIGHATKGEVIQATYRAFPNGGSARWAICEFPYGLIGDRLWVKETFYCDHCFANDYDLTGKSCTPALTRAQCEAEWREMISYRADYGEKASVFSVLQEAEGDGPWKPSIFMWRWASRINLEIAEVRVERLQEISEEDAWAEGCEKGERDDRGGWFPKEQLAPKGKGLIGWDCARDWYRDLWNDINLRPSPIYETSDRDGLRWIIGYRSYPWSFDDFDERYPGVRERGSYHGVPITVTENPWVWVITFHVVPQA